MQKSADAFRTISEVADDLELPQHVLRFWETRFPQIRPLKRAGGRRYYRPTDVVLLRTIRQLLYDEGYTIKGVQRLLKEQGSRGIASGDTAVRDRAGSALPDVDQAGADSHAGMLEAADIEDEPHENLPQSVRAALDRLEPPSKESHLLPRDSAALRETIAAIEECMRILDALRRPPPP